MVEHSFRTEHFPAESFVPVGSGKLPDGLTANNLAGLFQKTREIGTPLFGAEEPVGNDPCRLAVNTDAFYIEASHNHQGDGDILTILRRETDRVGITTISTNTTKLENGVIVVWDETLTADEIVTISTQITPIIDQA